ncbi:endonuclease III, partial [Ligilactobacillus salivarius]
PLLPTCPSAGEFLEIAAERKARATRRAPRKPRSRKTAK